MKRINPIRITLIWINRFWINRFRVDGSVDLGRFPVVRVLGVVVQEWEGVLRGQGSVRLGASLRELLAPVG